MRKLTESLLELARYDSGQEKPCKRDPFDLARVSRIDAELLHPLASERGVLIETRFSAAPTTGDADRIRQVVINLISNAIYYNKPAGRIHVSTRNANGETVLVVTDTGLGSRRKICRTCSKDFIAPTRPLSASGNSGLGLAICKAIVASHAGKSP